MSDTNNSPAVAEPVDTNADVPSEGTNVPETETEGQEPVAPKPRNVKKLKLKVDGEEIDEEVDLDDDEGLTRKLQMAKAAQKRMSEASKVRREAEQFVHLLKTDPVSLLTNPNLGVDFRKIAEEYLANQLEEETLTPEQKRIRQAEQIIREHEENKRRQAEEESSRQEQELQEKYAQDYSAKITGALEMGGVPKTRRTVKRMAELMHKNLEYGYELEPQHLVEMVREDYLNEIKELFGASDGDTLLKLLGDETANKIRKADLARLRGGSAQPKAQAHVAEAQPQERRTMSTEEWMDEVRKRARS